MLLKMGKREQEFRKQLEKEKLLQTCLSLPGGGGFLLFSRGWGVVGFLFVFKPSSGKANLR